jgi:hypothetical protein
MLKIYNKIIKIMSIVSYQSYSDFTNQNEKYELGNDWGFYDDIELNRYQNSNHNANANANANANHRTKMLVAHITSVSEQNANTNKTNKNTNKYSTIQIPLFKPNLDQQIFMGKIKKPAKDLNKVKVLDKVFTKDGAFIENISQYFSNGVIFTTFVVVMFILK